ncbi:PTS sugar transporter subunit IIA [Clostridiales bacterium COT073_COT-073]|nr:PTS sugar transporter subunit IIA [Clostridiales bacterium COT073_COT-073]
MLKDILNNHMVRLDIDVENWEDAIRCAGEILLDQNIIENRYIDAMIQSVKKLGPYIVLLPGVALAHARPEDGTKQMGISFATLNPEIYFGNKDFDPVRLIICLSAIDDTSHLDILSVIAEILAQPQNIDDLLNCTDTEEFVNKMMEMENRI